ncbi:MAG TPA: hydantoinase/carbamoylase family amidase, partial [Roseiflexaceae bacterium]|nr:hydantoinase/carbamoylase family amidase [Roseiflexaceae bacterium]
EAHIEQGPILEAEKKTIGVVTGAQGQRWYEITLTGEEMHAGTTPMPRRKDALLGAARMVDEVNRIAFEHQPLARGTVGVLQVHPNSRNTIPGRVFFTVDLRHPDNRVLASMDAKLRARARSLATQQRLQLQIEQIWDFPAVTFDAACVSAVRTAADLAGLAHRDIVSGAGHDACYVARVAPTAMIFVPCADGISHNEVEDAQPNDLSAGCQVLLDAMVARANA